MSDDIVKRLHSQAHVDEYAGTYYMTKLHFPLLREAADEIERLRALLNGIHDENCEIKTWNGKGDPYCSCGLIQCQ